MSGLGMRVRWRLDGRLRGLLQSRLRGLLQGRPQAHVPVLDWRVNTRLYDQVWGRLEVLP